jgi:hypothetical protein
MQVSANSLMEISIRASPGRFLERPVERPVKNCKLCRLNKVCNDLPGICILFQYAAPALVAGVLIYLFVTQELLG